MQNVSEEFKRILNESSDIELKSLITFPSFEIGNELISKIDLDSSLVFSEDFEIGTAPMDTAKIEIMDEENNIDYSFEDKECEIKLGLKLENGFIEYVSLGLFTVEETVKKDNIITLNCVDRMYKAEKEFKNNLMFPATLLDILQSACEQSGITLATTNFANADYVVPNEPVFEGITCRHIFAQVAELAGGYAKINRSGELEILTLGTESMRDITKDHYFDFKINEVAIGKIDKVIVKVGEETAELGEGENIYTIVDNMFVQDPNNVIGPIFNVLKNVNYTACDLNFVGDFSLDLGDRVTIDGHETYILDRKLKYTGGLREDYKAPAKSNVERNSTGKSNLILDMNNVKTQIKVIEGEITQTIEKVENLVVDAANRLYQSQTQIPFNLNNGNGEIQLFREALHPYYKVTSNTNIDLSASFPQSQFAENLEGEEVTISLDVLVDVDRIVSIDGKEFEVRGNRWTRIHVTKVFPVNTTKNVRVRNPYSRKLTRDKVVGTKLIDSLSTDINTIYYRNLQVQKGNVATRYTLTPEELEDNINRISTEFKQLEDSLTLLARKNEDSGKFEVNANYIIGEINKTDGVGRVKTVGVTIDENGLTVDNGAIIIRDSTNTAIITSDGLRVMFMFTSSGEMDGWQVVGILDGGYIEKRNANINLFVPENIVVTKATFITRSMPFKRSGWSGEGIPDGYYHARNLRLYKSEDGLDGFVDYPFGSSWGLEFGINGMADITNSVWNTTSWTPSGSKIVVREDDITSHITAGQNHAFAVQTTNSPTQANSRYCGAMQLEVIIEGFLKGVL